MTRLPLIRVKGRVVTALYAKTAVSFILRCEKSGLSAGCDDYTTKPIDKDAVISTCGKWLNNAAATRSASIQSLAQASSDAAPQSNFSQMLFSELLNDDPNLAPLVDKFLNGLESKVQRMQQFLIADQREELASLAHQLKGAGGGYGFPAISDAAEQVEGKATSDTELREIQMAISELSRLCQQAIAGGVRLNASQAGAAGGND